MAEHIAHQQQLVAVHKGVGKRKGHADKKERCKQLFLVPLVVGQSPQHRGQHRH